jgi:rhodanese-related sulfurtransferase
VRRFGIMTEPAQPLPQRNVYDTEIDHRMNARRFAAEAATIVIAAVLCAVVANALASRDRKMALAGSYPNALKVPQQSAPPAPMTVPSMETSAAAAPSTITIEPYTTGTLSAPTATAAIQTVGLNPTPPASKPVKPPTATTIQAPPAAAKPADLSRFAPHDKVAYVELHGDDVAQLYKAGVLFLDARRSSVYAEGHIAGARSFPVWESDIMDRVGALAAEGRDPKQPIVIYCSGGDCEDSHMLAEKLWGVFFNNAYVYKDGFPDWKARGGAIHTGDKP